MGDRPEQRIKIIRPQVEILPLDHSEPESSAPRSRVWLSVDSQGGTRRVYVAKPGPIASFLLMLGLGAILITAFVATFVFAAVFAGIAIVTVAGLSIYGLIRRSVSRLR